MKLYHNLLIGCYNNSQKTSKTVSLNLYLVILTLLFSCSIDKQETCDLCNTILEENKTISYPERQVRGLAGCGIYSPGAEKLIQVKRALTPWEYKKMEEKLFCFVGKNEIQINSYFKYFLEYHNTTYSRDSIELTKEILVNVYNIESFPKDIYKNGTYKSLRLDFKKLENEYVFTGTHKDSINLSNCLNKHK